MTEENQDAVFTDEAAEAAAEAGGEVLEDTAPKKGKRKRFEVTDVANTSGRLFPPSKDEMAAEKQRQQDRQVGLLIGPKNLEKLRAFGWDVVSINDNRQPLTPGIAHRGMTE